MQVQYPTDWHFSRVFTKSGGKHKVDVRFLNFHGGYDRTDWLKIFTVSSEVNKKLMSRSPSSGNESPALPGSESSPLNLTWNMNPHKATDRLGIV